MVRHCTEGCNKVTCTSIINNSSPLESDTIEKSENSENGTYSKREMIAIGKS